MNSNPLSEATALKLCQQFEAFLNRSPQTPLPSSTGNSVTLGEFAVSWFDMKKNDILDTTYNKYLCQYKSHIQPYFADKFLSEINRQDVQQFINALYEEGYAQETIKAIKASLSAMFTLAVADGYISHNPCDAVKLRKVTKKKKRPATPKEYLKLLEVARHHRLWISIPFLFLTGCRRGEMLALTWNDIDLDKRVIHITKQYTTENGNGRGVLRDSTKTIAGIRDIPICDDLYNYLQRYRKENMDKHYFIPQLHEDKMTHPQTFYKLFNRWKDEANIPRDVTPHSARHYFVSEMLKAGVAPERLRKVSGHHDLSTLLDVYGFSGKMDAADFSAIQTKMGVLSPNAQLRAR